MVWMMTCWPIQCTKDKKVILTSAKLQSQKYSEIKNVSFIRIPKSLDEWNNVCMN